MTVQEMAQAFLELTAADEAELRAKAAAEMNRAKPLPTTADHIFTLPRRTHDTPCVNLMQRLVLRGRRLRRAWRGRRACG
jgi:hypothetical protein